MGDLIHRRQMPWAHAAQVKTPGGQGVGGWGFQVHLRLSCAFKGVIRTD